MMQAYPAQAEMIVDRFREIEDLAVGRNHHQETVHRLKIVILGGIY